MTRIWLAATAAFVLLQSAASAQSAPTQADAPVMPGVLAAGMEQLCASFLSKPAAAPEAVAAMAAKAGFQPGAEHHYGAVGQPIPGAPAAMAFHAGGSTGSSVEMFLTTVPVACQVRVMGGGEAWAGFEAQMKRHGAKLMTSATITPETTYSHEVYVGGIVGAPSGYTTFVNRWVGAGEPKSGAWTMINVLPDTGAGG